MTARNTNTSCLEKHDVYNRQHVLLRLMFLFALIISFVCYFFFLNLTFYICNSLWAVSFLSATFECHKCRLLFQGPKELEFLLAYRGLTVTPLVSYSPVPVSFYFISV